MFIQACENLTSKVVTFHLNFSPSMKIQNTNIFDLKVNKRFLYIYIYFLVKD